MNTKYLALIVIGGLIVLLGGCACNINNSLAKKDQEVKSSWSGVETNYQRRTDLYSSVIKVIEGAANFEKSTLKDVIDARSRATAVQVDINDPATLEKYQQMQGQLQSAFGRLMAVSEAYPDLKTTRQFQDFQAQIEGTENRINIARQTYNKAVKDFNTVLVTFPNSLFARFLGFKEKAYYKADPGAERNPNIEFNIK
jgi:LemA protein